MTFEDPTTLARCIKSDCDAYRAGNTPFCAAHLREQETRSPGITEPEVEERARAAGDAVEELYAGPDPDTNGLEARPALEGLEPHWDGSRWILRPRPVTPTAGYPQKMARIAALCRELMAECGIFEAGG